MWDENARINKDYVNPLPLRKPGKRKKEEGKKDGRKKERKLIEMQHNEDDNLQECFPPPAFILSSIPAFTLEH